ncbi:MAG: Gfo/Idh/MocA family oxidoreductase [Novosphingobium sp.]
MANLKALVVGTGFGCRIQIPALRGAGFDVVGLVGADRARTAERALANGVSAAFTDLGEAIEATHAEVVAVSTPPHSHAALTMQALSRGSHVLCEKPFARDAAEARSMLAAATAAGKVHMLGHEFRYIAQRAAVGRAIGEGLIGEPRTVSMVQLLPHIPVWENSMPGWWFDPAEGGGWLGASMPHLADQLRTWLGEFASVSASLSAVTVSRGPVDDTFSARFAMASGAQGVIQYCAGVYGPMMDLAHVSGSLGSIWTDGAGIKIADKNGTRDYAIPADLALPSPPPVGGDPRHLDERWKSLVGIELAPYTMLCCAFRAAILGETSPSPVEPATFADGVAAMEIIDAFRASAADGGKLVEV